MEHVQMLHIITTAVYWVQDQGNRGNDSVSFKADFEWSSGDVGGDLEFCIQDCEKKLTTFAKPISVCADTVQMYHFNVTSCPTLLNRSHVASSRIFVIIDN